MNFSYPIAFDVVPSEYCYPVWYGKIEWSAYPMVKNFEDISRSNRIPACDRQTDRQLRRAVKMM